MRSNASGKVLKKVAKPERPGRALIGQAVKELRKAGDAITVSQACKWSGYSRRSWYYRSTKGRPKVNEHLAARAKRVIDQLPYAGYRTVAWLLGENKNTIQRLFQLKGWQVRKRKSGARPRVQALPSVASRRTSAGLRIRIWPVCGVAL